MGVARHPIPEQVRPPEPAVRHGVPITGNPTSLRLHPFGVLTLASAPDDVKAFLGQGPACARRTVHGLVRRGGRQWGMRVSSRMVENARRSVEKSYTLDQHPRRGPYLV
jgi:hypothetical protein